MSAEALIRLSVSAAALVAIRAAVMHFIYPHYKRIEDRSREKAKARLEHMLRHR